MGAKGDWYKRFQSDLVEWSKGNISDEEMYDLYEYTKEELDEKFRQYCNQRPDFVKRQYIAEMAKYETLTVENTTFITKQSKL